MRYLLAAVLLLASINSHALLIHFSGEVTDTAGDGYGHKVGDWFEGYVNFNEHRVFEHRFSERCTLIGQRPSPGFEICGHGSTVSDSVLGDNKTLSGRTPLRPYSDTAEYGFVRGRHYFSTSNVDTETDDRETTITQFIRSGLSISGTEGLFTLIKGQTTVLDFSKATGGQFSVSNYFEDMEDGFKVDIKSVGVPEPATWGMLLLGFAGLVLRRNLRHNRQRKGNI